MNILKQLNQSGWDWGTCSDLVEWFITSETAYEMLEKKYSLRDELYMSYFQLSYIHEANDQLRNPLSIEDFNGEDAIFDGFKYRKTTNCVEPHDSPYWIQFYGHGHFFGFFVASESGPRMIQSLKTREDFIRACIGNGIPLNQSSNIAIKAENS